MTNKTLKGTRNIYHGMWFIHNVEIMKLWSDFVNKREQTQTMVINIYWYLNEI